MKTFLKHSIIILIMVLSSCAKEKVFTKADIQIIPKPASVELKKGVFKFSERTQIVITDTSQDDLSKDIISRFKEVTGWDLKITDEAPDDNYIQFVENNAFTSETYELEIAINRITITAKDQAGFLYGIETVFQLLPPEIYSQTLVPNIELTLPNIIIKDKPRYQWRGLMLDITRHFFKKDYIKKTIDRLAMHKMNKLHLHLLDDQGWRIEIKKYPKLTEIGAWRVDQEDKHWNAREINDPKTKGTYGGFLTQDDLKEIVAYAESKQVEVIPEIEMPAHVSCAIAAYPELSCFNKRIAVPSGGVWPITDIYCAGKETTFEFLQNVLDEVMTIFPSKYIHIGGDEATKTNWEKCPNCQKRMATENLKDTHELQSYFVKRMEKYINAKGKKLIGWDEILEGGLAPDATVMSWRGVKGGYEASEQGHDVIMTPGTHCYFDHYQGNQNDEPLAIGGYSPLSKVYQFDPVVDSMSVEQKKHVLGGQANLWSEYIPTIQHSEYMIFPRLAALAEAVWSPKELRDWNDFSKRIEMQFKRYDNLDINYAKSAYQIRTTVTENIAHKEVTVSLENEFPNPDIRYVLGDAVLDDTAKKYKDTIRLTKTTIVKASLFKQGKPIGKTRVDTIIFHKAFAKGVTYNTSLSKSYKGDDYTLVNAVRGSKNFHDGQWQAWLNKDMEVVIDLEKDQEIHQVVVGSMENQGAGVYFPLAVKVYSSNDGKSYQKIGETTRPYANNAISQLQNFTVNFKEQKARYVKVIATNLKDHPEATNVWGSTFLFIDEILVN